MFVSSSGELSDYTAKKGTCHIHMGWKEIEVVGAGGASVEVQFGLLMNDLGLDSRLWDGGIYPAIGSPRWHGKKGMAKRHGLLSNRHLELKKRDFQSVLAIGGFQECREVLFLITPQPSTTLATPPSKLRGYFLM